MPQNLIQASMKSFIRNILAACREITCLLLLAIRVSRFRRLHNFLFKFIKIIWIVIKLFYKNAHKAYEKFSLRWLFIRIKNVNCPELESNKNLFSLVTRCSFRE